jgi:hypothetical protein
MNTVKFIGLDVHKKKRSPLPLPIRGVKTNPEATGPLPTIWTCWTNFVVKWSPPQAGCILFMKPAPAATAFTGI